MSEAKYEMRALDWRLARMPHKIPLSDHDLVNNRSDAAAAGAMNAY